MIFTSTAMVRCSLTAVLLIAIQLRPGLLLCNENEIIEPSFALCGPIFFLRNSGILNKEHRACVDDVALMLQQDPRSSLVIDGNRNSSEQIGISLTRANSARNYLVNEKGIDAARLTVRNFGDTCPHKSGNLAASRRVEFWILPGSTSIKDIKSVCAQGATPEVISTEEPAPSIQRHRPINRVHGQKKQR